MSGEGGAARGPSAALAIFTSRSVSSQWLAVCKRPGKRPARCQSRASELHLTVGVEVVHERRGRRRSRALSRAGYLHLPVRVESVAGCV